MSWLLFLPQLPASPSTLRVTVWRRMRATGAFGLQNGVWVLPLTPENKQFVEKQMIYIREQGAESFLFEVICLNPSVEEMILTGFRTQRDEEYTEFCERGEALLAELEKETTSEKFTFAELEETENDLHKLETWLGKIIGRDFIGSNQKIRAMDTLERCKNAYEGFATKVYLHQGIAPLDHAEG